MFQELPPEMMHSYKSKYEPGRIFWLINTSYGRNNNHNLHLIDQEGNERIVPVVDVYPYFYVNTHINVEERIKWSEMEKYVRSVKKVQMIHPISREKLVVYKVEVIKPMNVTNNKNPRESVSSIFSSDEVHNNRVKYHNVVLNEKGYVMGMPYHITVKGQLEAILDVDKYMPMYNELVFPYIRDEAKEVGQMLLGLIHAPMLRLSDSAAVLDIEVQANFAESIDVHTAEAPISSVSVTTKDYTKVFVLEDNVLDVQPAEDPSVFDDGSFTKEKFRSEKQLLSAYMTHITNMKQKILIMHHGDGFDIPYLSRRLALHKLTAYKIESKEMGTYLFKTHIVKWTGKYILDSAKFFHNPNVRTGAYSSRYENVKLSTLGKELVGRDKYDYEGRIEELSSDELAFYNAKDTQLTFDIMTHDDDFPSFILFFIMRFSNLSIQDANRRGVTEWWSGFMYRYLHNIGVMYANVKDLAIRIGEVPSELMGAFTMPASLGIHQDVNIFDLASLYPSNQIKHNICFSTVMCDHLECMPGSATANIIMIAEFSTWTCRKYYGYMPMALTFLRETRVRIYKPRAKPSHIEYKAWYIALAQFFKIFMNAGGYGILSNPGYAFWNLTAANMVTATSRATMREMIELIKQYGGEPIYGDSVAGSDSILVQFNNEPPFIMSIENLWLVLTNIGYAVDIHRTTKERLPLEDLGFKVWDGENWNPIRAIIRHFTTNSIYRVTTVHGAVDVTADHSLIDAEGKKFPPTHIKPAVGDEYNHQHREPYSEVTILSEDNLMPREQSKKDLLLSLLGLLGTTSIGLYLYPSQRNLVIQSNEKYDGIVQKILVECNDVLVDLGAHDYKRYPIKEKNRSGNRSDRTRINYRFKANSNMWDFARGLYVNNYKIKPSPTCISLHPDHQILLYDLMTIYYYKPNKQGSVRWYFPSSAEMQAFAIIALQVEGKLTKVYTAAGRVKGYNAYPIEMWSNPKASVSAIRKYDDFVYDLETENGTFMAGGIKVSNTDSVFTSHVPRKNEYAAMLTEKLGIEVENEGFIDLFWQYKKKNYIKFTKENGKTRAKIMGMTGIKSSTPKLIQKLFKECIDSISVDMDQQTLKNHIYTHINKATALLQKRQFVIEDLQLVQSLNKDLCNCPTPKYCDKASHYKANTPVVQAAEKMKQFLESHGEKRQFGRAGVMVDYVKSVTGWTPTVLVKKPIEIDVDHYIETLHSVFDQLIDPVYSKVGKRSGSKKLKDEKEQTTLAEFF
jgi:DNA polymerase elongation subunit (family B)